MAHCMAYRDILPPPLPKHMHTWLTFETPKGPSWESLGLKKLQLSFLQMPASTVSAFPKPDYPGPHNFLAYVLIVAVICGVLNLFSLAFSVPAIVCVIMVRLLGDKIVYSRGLNPFQLKRGGGKEINATAACLHWPCKMVSKVLKWACFVVNYMWPHHLGHLSTLSTQWRNIVFFTLVVQQSLEMLE